jgi:hypothetical protein
MRKTAPRMIEQKQAEITAALGTLRSCASTFWGMVHIPGTSDCLGSRASDFQRRCRGLKDVGGSVYHD